MEGVYTICEDKDILIKRDYKEMMDRIRRLETYYDLVIEAGGRSGESEMVHARTGGHESLRDDVSSFEMSERLEAVERRLVEMVEVVAKWEGRCHGLVEVVARQAEEEKGEEVLGVMQELRAAMEQVRRNAEGLKRSVDSRIEKSEVAMDKKVKQLNFDKLKNTEALKSELLDTIMAGNERGETRIGDVIEGMNQLNMRIDTLEENHNMVCQESAHLLSNICQREKIAEQQFSQINERLDGLESLGVKRDEADDSQDSRITKEDLNEYYADLRQKVNQKVELSEVQIALNSMHKKLNLILAKELAGISRRLDQIQGLEIDGDDARSSELNGDSKASSLLGNNAHLGPWKIQTKKNINDSLWESDKKEIFDQLASITEAQSKKINLKDFEAFLRANKQSWIQLELKLNSKVDQSDFHEALNNKAGK